MQTACGHTEVGLSLSHLFDVECYYPGNVDVELELFAPSHSEIMCYR